MGAAALSVGAGGAHNPLSGILGRLANPAALKDFFYNSGTFGTIGTNGGTAAGISSSIAGSLGGGTIGNVLGHLTGGLSGFATSPGAGAIGGALALAGLSQRSSVKSDARRHLLGELFDTSLRSKIPGVGVLGGAAIGGGAGLFASGIKRGGIVGIGEDIGGGALAGFGIGNAIAPGIGGLIGAGVGAAALP